MANYLGRAYKTDIGLELRHASRYRGEMTPIWICRCSKQHRTNVAFAKCALETYDLTMLGTGRYAYVSFCDQGNDDVKYGNRAYVRLYGALHSLTKRLIEDNVNGCCKSCNGREHHMGRLVPVLRYQRSKQKV